MSKLHSLGALCRYVKTLKMPKPHLILRSWELRTGQEVSVILRNKKQVLANWLAGWLASQQADRLASRQAGSPYQSS